jgi:uncharacterized protein (TIRG00374 family)
MNSAAAEAATPGLATPHAFAPGDGLRTSLRWGGLAAACVLGVLALLIGLGVLDPRAIVAAATQLDAWTLVAILVLSLVNYLLRGLRWHLLTRAIAPQVPLGSNLAYYVAGFAFVVTPAKLGEVVRLWLLKSRHGVAYERSVSLLVLDRLLDLVALLAFGGIGIMAATTPTGALGLVVAGLAAATLLLCWRRAVVTAAVVAHRMTGRRWPGLIRFLLGAYRTLRSLCSPVVLAAGLALSLLAWASMIAGMWLLLAALGFDADPLFSRRR